MRHRAPTAPDSPSRFSGSGAGGGQRAIDTTVIDTAANDVQLPRPPGVLRRFWAKHHRLADWLVVAVVLFFELPTVVVTRAELPGGALGLFWLWLSAILAGTSAFSLAWRRRFPLVVFIITAVPLVLLAAPVGNIGGLAASVALYSVAVHRSIRAAAWALVVAIGSAALASLASLGLSLSTLNDATSLLAGTTVLLLIGMLVGANVGGRKRYVEGLIARFHSLEIERDQQAQIAAAGERTRIAREMHDIVSHSLAVVVTLAEGAHATDDAARAKQATRAIADTARDALDQMRVMLGVLHEPGTDADHSRAPILAQTPASVVTRAREAGLPVTLTVTGDPHASDAQQLAVLRIVQEGLTNALRYAHLPTAVAVTTDYRGDEVAVTVVNDGVRAGAVSPGSGRGIHGLRERVQALGGELEAGPTGDAGWRLQARFPKEDAHA